ncbi:hypothetical protein BJ878DRAFT_179417 [Calycina marina]|uniref:Uncharacterized protein n=1 Tax=Calycina marina TaxID=1763456 RepID=A0A9P7YYG3_9HELO|nr:hypothetical protein BJ878DRAFT_179417 [Calycina marina]
MKSIQSPLFVSTDSDSDSDEVEDEKDFDSDAFDNDNDSIASESLTPTEIEQKMISKRNTHAHSHLSSTARSLPFRSLGRSEETHSSSDPFAANYRKKVDVDDVAKERWRQEWHFVTDFLEKYESVEHAEFTRPFDQFRVLIQERSLHVKYEMLFVTSPDAVTRSCYIMNMLLEEAPDLISRYAALERLTKERMEFFERGGKAEWEVAWETRRRAELGPWVTPRL